MSHQNNYIFSFERKDKWLEERREDGSKNYLLSTKEYDEINKTLQTYNAKPDVTNLYVCLVNEWPIALIKKMDESISSTSEWVPYTGETAKKEIVERFKGLIGGIVNEALIDYPNSSTFAVAKFIGNYLDTDGKDKDQHGYLRHFYLKSSVPNRENIKPSLVPIAKSIFFDRLKKNVESIINELNEKQDQVNDAILAQTFKSYVEEQSQEVDELKQLILEVERELAIRDEALLKDYGYLKVEELSNIQKIFYKERFRLTSKNLNNYLSMLHALKSSAHEFEEKILSIPDTDYEELRNLSRLSSVGMSDYLSWPARRKLLVAWAEKEYLPSNGWLGYDENKVIELLARAPKKDANDLLNFFKSSEEGKEDYKYLFKFFDDLNDAMGKDHNSLFIDVLVQTMNKVLADKLISANGTTDGDKLFDLLEKKDIKGFFYSIDNNECNSYKYSKETDYVYRVASQYCICRDHLMKTEHWYYDGKICDTKILSEELLGPLDLVLIIKGKDLSILDPEVIINSEFEVEVVPAIYFRYLNKEGNIKLAKDIGFGTLTVLSFAIPGTIIVRAVYNGSYLVAALAGVDLLTNSIVEISSSPRVMKYLVNRYGSNAHSFIAVVNGVNMLSGNINAPVKATKAVNMADDLLKMTKNLPREDLSKFVSIAEDLKNNSKALIESGEFTAKELANIEEYAKFVKADLAKTGKAVGKVEVVSSVASKWLDDLPAKLNHLKSNPEVLSKLDAIANGDKGIDINKFRTALEGDLGDIIAKAAPSDLNSILNRFDQPHMTGGHLDEITQRLANADYGIKKDLLDNPGWFDTFDDILKEPGRYWDVLSEGNIAGNSPLAKWGQGKWWKNLREKARNFERYDPNIPHSGKARDVFISNNKLAQGKVVDQVTIEVDGVIVRIDYLGRGEDGLFHLGDAKFSTMDKNWSSDWLDAATQNQKTVFPSMKGKDIKIKASDPDKLDAIYEAFGIKPSSFNNGSFSIPSNQIGSLKVFGSAADDISTVKNVVKIF